MMDNEKTESEKSLDLRKEATEDQILKMTEKLLSEEGKREYLDDEEDDVFDSDHELKEDFENTSEEEFEKELEEALDPQVDSFGQIEEELKTDHPMAEEITVERKKKPLWPVFLVGILVPILLLAAFLYYDYQSRVYLKAAVEAGTQIEAMDFAKNPLKEVSFAEAGFLPDTTVPGEYTFKLNSGIYTYDCSLTVVDTIAPVGSIQNLQIMMGDTISPEDFFTEIVDSTKVTATFTKAPDYSLQGEQMIGLCLTDLGGNTAEYEAVLATRITYTEITVEAGTSAPTLEDLLVAPLEDAVLVTDTEELDLNRLEDQIIQVRYNQKITDTVMHVVDTTEPLLQTKDIEAFLSSELSAEDFVDVAKDATELTYAFEVAPNMAEEGLQKVTIVATDMGGNSTTEQASLRLVADTEPPVFSGVDNISVRVGAKISYRNNVTIRDNCDEDIDFDVDASDVDTAHAGTYVAIYTATDRAGNTVSKEINVIVTEAVETHTLEEVNALADKVIAKIITADMTQRQMLDAIYGWAHGNVTYIDHSSHDDYLQGAYEGFTLHKGDCFVFASTAKVLLDRVGITNRDIRKIPAASNHFWNLVDIGEGWYHFDTTPRKGRPNLCYLTDSKLMEYSNSHNLSHNYDREVYTDIVQ